MRDELRYALADLVDAYPRAKISQATIKVYAADLAGLDPVQVADACQHLMRTSVFFPTLAEIRRQVAEQSLRLPTPERAWLSLTTDDEDPLGKEVLRGMGGSYALRTSENPDIFRAQFLKFYAEYRERIVVEVMAASGRPVIEA